MKINVNGKDHHLEAPEGTSLLDALRVHLNLTGSKYGCGEGACGACMVLIDGHATPSCITPLISVGNKVITTIEGLEKDGELHPLQQAFADEGAFQCGYCTSGMIISALALKNRNPRPNRQEVIEGMQGNICRCCAYPRIINAITKA